MSDWAKLATLELAVDDYGVERHELAVSSQFKRVTTTILLRGGGHEGRGEDVSYSEQPSYPENLELRLRGTLAGFSRVLDSLSLPYDYSRWAFESAALDLALRQAGISLAAAVGREYRPLTFVASTRSVDGWLEIDPHLEFKVDPTSAWTREYMDTLAATGRIRVVDLKGHYVGTPVDQPADPRLYRDVLDAFPDAIVEDAAFTDETRPILRPAYARLSFDAPVHSVEDLAALEIEPRFLNVKPSRFGTLRRLFDCLAYCAERGISMYGGGQFELGVGRDQIQALASLYYADAYNDVAPAEYNAGGPRPGLPRSPLQPGDGRAGFSFRGA
jgi:hypothetical protein